MHQSDLSPVWRALQAHHDAHGDVPVADLFAADPGRAGDFSYSAAGVTLDLSKNRLGPETRALLLKLAQEREVPAAIAGMFAGQRINVTEDRAVLHVALRAPADARIEVDGVDVVPLVHEQLGRMRELVARLHDGRWRGYDDRRIRHVVHIGIGGSDLGPRMVTRALWPYLRDGIEVRFVANLDGADISKALRGLDPATTLFIVASKSFTTAETMTNARTARAWLLRSAPDKSAVAKHFVALSANVEATSSFGIAPDNVLHFWDWVGGRFSLWSVIGMPIAVAVGYERFEQLLAGAHAMDRHFATAPLADNLPVLLALTGIWYRNFCGRGSHAILPYDDGLAALPAYLQQAEMESNGKGVRSDGSPVAAPTAPVIWGDVGTNAQHAFFQLLHQGTDWVPADFIAPLAPQHELHEHHAGLLANCFAQSEALLRGDPDADDPHRRFTGNRPSTTILVDRLTPARLGALIALYEHKIFVQGRIWGINSFDQFGVELGKTLAGGVAAAFADGRADSADVVSRTLIARYLQQTT